MLNMDDWKLKAQAVVKLQKEHDVFVSSYCVFLSFILLLCRKWLRQSYTFAVGVEVMNYNFLAIYFVCRYAFEST